MVDRIEQGLHGGQQATAFFQHCVVTHQAFRERAAQFVDDVGSRSWCRRRGLQQGGNFSQRGAGLRATVLADLLCGGRQRVADLLLLCSQAFAIGLQALG